MITTLTLLWFVLSPAALIPARSFIQAHSGERFSVFSLCLLLIALNLVIFSSPGALMQHIASSAFMTFLAQLAFLDARKHWLPLCFTTAFIVAGIVMAISPGHVLAAIILWLPFFVMEHYPNGPGRGDKWLCAGLGMWQGLHQGLLILALSLLLLFLVTTLIKRNAGGQPLAPSVLIASVLLFPF
ncbi:Type IV leader peptidase family [Serratia fonticola]|uniref:prepilin peptidase n=1 Tax=Serratia fonticola TaxID=47917 RepID=UPI002177461A|nr:prepilin peptidase [Serratia fonticola]CAI2031492.1 Type IV leader peptidase family [Serratia fonticola]